MIYKTATLIIIAAALAIITSAEAQEFAGRVNDQDRKGVKLAIMGGRGMMGGGGMMNGRGLDNGFGWPQRDSRVPGYEYQQSRNLDNERNQREEIRRLRERVQQKRRELSSLYRSGTADEGEINRNIDELGDLERNLDEKISNYNAGR